MADDYGPGGANGLGLPVYDRPIPVFDAMVGTLKGDRRYWWRFARDKTLEEWGLDFEVTPYPEANLPYRWTLENVNQGLAITDVMPRRILLVRLRTGTGEDFAGWIDSEGGGIACYSPTSDWGKKYQRQSLKGLIGHELGHCLGFNHGGTGIMMGGWTPNDTDVRLAKEYYL